MRFASYRTAALMGIAALGVAAAGPVTTALATQPAKKGFLAPGHSLFMVFANPVDGEDAAFNAWYDKHMRSIVKLPEFFGAQRYTMQPRAGRPDPEYKYVVVYEIIGDPDKALAALGAAVKRGDAEAPDPRWVLKTQGMAYRPVTDLYK